MQRDARPIAGRHPDVVEPYVRPLRLPLESKTPASEEELSLVDRAEPRCRLPGRHGLPCAVTDSRACDDGGTEETETAAALVDVSTVALQILPDLRVVVRVAAFLPLQLNRNSDWIRPPALGQGLGQFPSCSAAFQHLRTRVRHYHEPLSWN